MTHLTDYLQQLRDALDALDLKQVELVRERFAAARERDAQIFLCGNGGSGATASHLANDLGKGASLGQGRRFRVIALTDNVPWISALANDISYDVIFAEQLRNLSRPGDVLLAISGSGNSANIIQAVDAARELGVESIGWTGFGGGKLAELADHSIVVDSHHMGRVEDVHTILMHLICYYFMEVDVS
ncbi:MAG: SIS domain-containing protein [Gemmatimonadetes bacterium]|nr:SIS domain-containing protein [Gemmatimonadota bacterium]